MDINKARVFLNWNPTLRIKEAIKYTVEWHKKCYENKNMYDVTIGNIGAEKKFIKPANKIVSIDLS